MPSSVIAPATSGAERRSPMPEMASSARGVSSRSKGRAAKQAVQLVQNFVQRCGDRCTQLRVADQRFQSGEMLRAQIAGQ